MKCPVSLTQVEIKSIISAQCPKPHNFLGMHLVSEGGTQGLLVRAFLKDISSCEIIKTSDESVRYSLNKIHSEGLFEVLITAESQIFEYRLRVKKASGEIKEFFDPYSFLPTLSQEDQYLFNEGNHHYIYQKLGAHLYEANSIKGVSFAVWAPAAKRISVVGDFNHWDGRYFPMRSLGSSGIWELFIPGLEEGTKYKYEIISADSSLNLKTDPYGSFFESPPHNASIVKDLSKYTWKDDKWLAKRAQAFWQEQPISIYELHLGSWKHCVEDGDRPLSYREIATQLVDYIKDMNFTHVEFMPLAEHPYSGSWGYQVTGFFAPTHRFGDPDDFRFLVDTLHQNNIGVIVDWVPAHFPKDSFALAQFDGTHLYEHEDPSQGEHKDWGTLIFNYGRHEVRNFLIASALAWMDRYHIDGFRVDAVASMLYLDYSRESHEWVPNKHGTNENLEAQEFLQSFNALVHQYYPGVITIAEESTAWGGVTQPTSAEGLGFDFKWNMGWMHDTLRYFSKDPVHRKWHHNDLTFGMLYQYSENFMSVFSHDEVVHGKASMLMKMGVGDTAAKAQALRALYTFMWAWPGKNTLFMGCEFGQSKEWHYDNSLDWDLLQYTDHQGIQSVVKDLNHWYVSNPSLAKYDHKHQGFRWINANDSDNSVLSFLRLGDTIEDTFLFLGNFTPIQRGDYRAGVPYNGFWKEILNTNASEYGGTGVGNYGGLHSNNICCDVQQYSLNLLLPGMSASIF